MKFQQEISDAFERNALEYFQKDFGKHKNYLLKVAFGRDSGMIPGKEFEDAIMLWGVDAKKCVRELFNVLLPVIQKTMETILGRASKLLDRYNNGTLSANDSGSGYILVQSERSSKTYTVNLTDLECDCPYHKKVRFAGMLCKHIFLADEIFGQYKKPRSTAKPTANTQPSRMDVESTSEFFSYGKQKLSKREKRGNPLIPSGITYILEGKSPEIAIYSLNSNESLLLIGESGVGKSKLIHYFAQETNTPLQNVCGHNEITVENLLGCMTVMNGNTVWKDGILPDAMRKGCWLLLDEINAIDPGVMKVINEVLDNRKITITVAGEPRIVKAHKDFRFVCTMNPPDSPIYKGIEMMSFEFMDRFDTVVHLDYLSPETESKLIMDMTGFSDEVTARKMVQFAGSIRQAMKQGEIFATVTTRSLISFCRKAQVFDVRTSADTAILRKMSTADRDKANDIFNAIFK